MGRGLGNAELESELKSGIIAGDRKQCKHAGASIQPDRMKYCLYANPQNVEILSQLGDGEVKILE